MRTTSIRSGMLTLVLMLFVSGCIGPSPVPDYFDSEPPSYTYTGKVMDASTGLPIAGARVYGDGGVTYTDSEGNFSFVSKHKEPRTSWWAIATCYMSSAIEWNGREGAARLVYHGETTLKATLKLKTYGLESIVRDGNITFRNIETGMVYADPDPSIPDTGSGVYVEIPVDPGTYKVESAWVTQGFTGHRYSASFSDWQRSIDECDTLSQTFSINVMP